MNIQQLIALGGMFGPILYTSIWILGGFLQPDYSHVRDDVSSLMAVGAPNKRLFDIMQLVNIILVIIFFTNFHRVLDGGQGSIIGPASFVLTNLINLPVVLFYPLDEGGGIESSTAQIHVKLVMIMAVFGAIGMLALWRRLSQTPGWEWYGTYSLATFIVTAITGAIAARTAGSDIMGLTERLVVTANVQYIFVLALRVFLIHS
ncbi:DUF998 domain-containing protein [Thermoproteota archaeon]